MDYRTYQQLRTYCAHDLRDHLNLPGYEEVMRVYARANGELGRLERERQLGLSLFQCRDLTPRELAAAALLADVSNHRAIYMQVEESPEGAEPAPPLEKSFAEQLAKQTRRAVKEYAVFLPPAEQAVLIENFENALDASSGTPESAEPPATVATPAKPGITRHKLRTNSLDAPIQKAIKLAGNTDTAPVFVQLKELAIGGELPFTGFVKDGALCYTDDNNLPATMTKAQLGKRLIKYRQ
ncbi:MAG: hypothetical protein HY777_02345 [Betaproteobacteria bacterium]|nr:hypothetical protein [Betaproteobacteria bacterium]